MICGACAYPFSTGDRWHRNELCELPEVLCGGCEVEFISCAARASQPETAEAQNSLQMREEHLHLLPELARDRVVGRLGDRTRPIPGGLEDRSRYLSTRLLGAAARLQVAGITIGLAGAVAKHAIFIGFFLPGFREGPAALLQLLAARADVDIPLGIIGEVGAFECPGPPG